MKIAKEKIEDIGRVIHNLDQENSILNQNYERNRKVLIKEIEKLSQDLPKCKMLKNTTNITFCDNLAVCKALIGFDWVLSCFPHAQGKQILPLDGIGGLK